MDGAARQEPVPGAAGRDGRPSTRGCHPISGTDGWGVDPRQAADSRKVIFALCHAVAECVGSKTRQTTGPALGNHGVLKTLAIASVLPTVRDLHMFNPIDNRGRRR